MSRFRLSKYKTSRQTVISRGNARRRDILIHGERKIKWKQRWGEDGPIRSRWDDRYEHEEHVKHAQQSACSCCGGFSC
jgi:hypothetical protein